MPDVLDKMIEFDNKRKTRYTVLAAHNGKTFDFGVLKKNLERYNRKIPDHWILFDTMYLLQVRLGKIRK